MGTGELANAHKAGCFQTVVSINRKSSGELRGCAPQYTLETTGGTVGGNML